MGPLPRRPRVLLLHYDFPLVEHGPLPPHERTWRHPSELAAEQHALARAETAGPTTRIFAFTTGTLGLLAVGLLIVAVTPGRSEAPVAVSATTTPVAADGAPAARPSASPEATDRAPIGLRGRPEVLATPIGEGRYAVVTAADLTGTGGSAGIGTAVAVEVPSGRAHDARVVGRAGAALLVELERTEPGIELADERPEGHDVVTVMAEPPVTIVLDDLAELAVEEGTAVLDDDGELVGLCSRGDDETELLIVIDEQPADDEGRRDRTGSTTGGGVSRDDVDATSDG